MWLSNLVKDEKKQPRLFLYGICASLVIHAGIFLMLMRLNEKWEWIPLNGSYVEVSLVSQAGPAAKGNPDAGKPAAQDQVDLKSRLQKTTHPEILKPKHKLVKPAEFNLKPKRVKKDVHHLPAETPKPAPVMTMLSDLQASAPESVGENAGSKEGGQDEGLKEGMRGSGGMAAAGIGGGGGGYGSRMSYLDMVRLKIEHHKKYPDIAQQRNLQGQVMVEFDINLDGRISEPSVSKSSGFRSLDLAALEAVKRASPFASPPRQFFNETIHINVPIRFELIR